LAALDGEHFDVAIIGAGMSGLAAGIRLALFNKKVIILERHNVSGGLNSFYSFGGRKYDVGLHAMTNFVHKGVKGTPLVKLLRQLRISRDDFDLSEQIRSRIVFPGVDLIFTNDFTCLESQIADTFPNEIDGFRRLTQYIREFDEVALSNEEISAKQVVRQYIKDPLLVDALFLPLCYYGSAMEDDMDWSQFVIMFKSIFMEGFARPFEGVRKIIRVLLDKYRQLGGIRKMKTGVRSIKTHNGVVQALELDSGETITADNVISSIGLVETARLCDVPQTDPKNSASNIGHLSFVETITVLNEQPKDLGCEDTIVFFNNTDHFEYKRPTDLVDPRSGVMCVPNNYQYPEDQKMEEGFLRVTALANYDKWVSLPEGGYQEQKQYWFEELSKNLQKTLFPKEINSSFLKEKTVAMDMFTPRTIQKYTGHLGGAVYGAPHKSRDGRTSIKNLYICGTDQGFLGIIGAMLSGISMANLHVLSAEKAHEQASS